jgi:nucleotide-binding universal stress UspA family protein
MLEKILYPTDFSEVAVKAFQFVKQMKGCGVEEVVILHVIDQRSIDALAIYTDRDFMRIEQEWESTVTERIGPMEEELKEMGFKVDVRIERGIPFADILKVEEEENVSVIVIGSHGKSNVREMLLGSVSEKVVRKARNPVLVVKR